MASIDEIFGLLVEADKQTEERNPFAPIADFAGNMNKSIIKASPEYDWEESAIAGLVSGLIGGLADNRANDFRADQNVAARDVLEASLGGYDVERPSGMDASIFNRMQNAGSIFKRQKAEEQAAAENAFKREVQLAGIKEKLANPYRSKKIDSVLGSIFSDGKRETTTDKVEILTRQPREAQGMVSQAPSIEDLLEKYQGDETLAREEMKDNLPMAKLENLVQLRKEFHGLPEVKDFKLVDTGYKALREAMKDPEGTSDYEIVRRAAQAVEPGLAVRKDDQDSIAQAASLFGQYGASIRNALQGKSKLTPEVRQGLMRVAQRGYNAHADAYNKSLGYYQNRTNKLGFEPFELSPLTEAEMAVIETPVSEVAANSGVLDMLKAEKARRQKAKMNEVRSLGIIP